MAKVLMWVLVGLAVIIVASAGVVIYEVNRARDLSDDIMVGKPAVYLYPLEDSYINVSLKINGKITKDDPKYNNGWMVFATKEGLIDGKYDYLFYEANLNELELPSAGWIVKYNDLESWFDTNLLKLGLNEKEIVPFKEYWLNKLTKPEYYEIKILESSFLDENLGLIVSPKPSTLIRLDFYFKPLKEEIMLQEPEIITPQRKGFTVVEWGGILDD